MTPYLLSAIQHPPFDEGIAQKKDGTNKVVIQTRDRDCNNKGITVQKIELQITTNKAGVATSVSDDDQCVQLEV